ncbi:MAG TPA: hypothetical protein VGI70_03110 [Polyangiales bacterium]
MAAGCQHDDGAPETSPLRLGGLAGSDGTDRMSDRDHDGLCDISERAFGTDPDALDTDGDGLPDVVEVITGYDPSDSTSPTRDQLGFLVAQPGATLQFPVSTTFVGVGQGATGLFAALSAVNPGNLRADHYFVDGVASSATPMENVRGIASEQEHFDSVLGSTRLMFALHFAYTNDPPSACALSLPFKYFVKSDAGYYTTGPTYMLVVGAETPPKAEDYCLPAACL